ncbi:MAG: flippase-like domain-containing protein [Firmicutes bacterium]|nr:flippase-like domain-containing protein [Bacillota bacterium]
MEKFAANKKRQCISIAVIATILAVTFFLLFRDQELPELLPLLKSLQPAYLLAAVLAMLAFFAFEALSLRLLLGALRYRPGFCRCYSYALINFYFSSITPGCCGGQPSQLYYMKRDGIGLGSSSLTVLLFNVAYHLSAITIILCALLWGGKNLLHDLSMIKYLLIYGMTVQFLCMAAYGFLIFSPKTAPLAVDKVIRLLAKLHIVKDSAAAEQKMANQLNRYRKGVSYIKKHPLILLKLFAITTCHVLVLYSVPYWIYRALGLSEYSLPAMLAIQTVLTLALESLPIPGGAGVAEGSYLLVYGQIFGPALVVPALLLCRGMNYYSGLLAGGLVSAYAHSKRLRLRRLRPRLGKMIIRSGKTVSALRRYTALPPMSRELEI